MPLSVFLALVMTACVACGFYAGYIIAHDRAEDREYQLRMPAGRHAARFPLRGLPCPLDTGELAVLHEVELDHFDRTYAEQKELANAHNV